MSKSRTYLALTGVLGLLSLAAAISLLNSEDTLTDRVAVEGKVFDQRPENLALIADGRRLELVRSRPELEQLRSFSRRRGFSAREPGEASLDFALRAATFVQDLIPHGRERKNYFRWWGYERVMEDIGRGETFWCGTYARLLVALALTEDIPARSVWMDGHVTSEIYSSEIDKWVIVDAMYNHLLQVGDRPLSAIEVYESVKRGHNPQVVLISKSPEMDEPVKASFNKIVEGVYRGGIFKVFDGDINFSSDRPHLLLPAISLSTDQLPGGTTLATRVLRPLVLVACILTLCVFAAYLKHRQHA